MVGPRLDQIRNPLSGGGLAIDTSPKSGSNNLINSGGVHTSLANKANSLVVTSAPVTISVSKDSTSNFKITQTKSGYTPISFTPISHGWSAEIVTAPEGIIMRDGYFEISGFARKHSDGTLPSVGFTTYILWVKN